MSLPRNEVNRGSCSMAQPVRVGKPKPENSNGEWVNRELRREVTTIPCIMLCISNILILCVINLTALPKHGSRLLVVTSNTTTRPSRQGFIVGFARILVLFIETATQPANYPVGKKPQPRKCYIHGCQVRVIVISSALWWFIQPIPFTYISH